MKSFTSMLLVFVLMAPSITRMYILTDFKINQDMIAELLCVKRNEVKSACQGNCVLTSKLQQQEQQEESNGLANIEFKLDLLFQVQSVVQNYRKDIFNSWTASGFYQQSIYNSAFLAKIFIPPRF